MRDRKQIMLSICCASRNGEAHALKQHQKGPLQKIADTLHPYRIDNETRRDEMRAA
jgi:hypothetical protein